MTRPPSSSSHAAGIALAVGALAGAFVGLRYHQPSLGLLLGLGLGAAIATAVWLVDRRR